MYTFREYLDFAEKHLTSAEEEIKQSRDVEWLLIPATTLAWSAIESFVNNRFTDFSSLPEDKFELHERAFLQEKRIRLISSGAKVGQFILEGTEYRPLEEKIFFLIAKFGRKGSSSVKLGDTLWQKFQDFKKTRDALVHPKQEREISITPEKVRKFINTSKEVIQVLSNKVWNKTIHF